MKKKSLLAAAIAACVAVASCATMGVGSDQPLTTQQKIARCAGMVAGGALLGAVIGNNTGSGDAGDGAVVGALLGGGACAVWLAFNSQADKDRMARLQLAAASSGNPQTETWTDEQGRVKSFSVAPSTATEMTVASAGGSRMLCRPLNNQASVGGRSEANSEVWCRNPDGTWSPQTATAAG